MKKISFKDVGLKYTLNPYDKPVLYIKPKERIVVDVEDASSGQIRKEGDVRDRSKVPFGNPIVGPIYVEGAQPGKCLAVKILDIKPTIGQGATYFSEFNERYLTDVPVLKFMGTRLPLKTKICKIEDEKVFFDKIVLPYNPMVGTVGVAPYPEAEGISSGVLPGKHGGNMDLPDVCQGASVFLPIFHEGGLLYIGDAHAIQGDGEISGTAVEMPAEIEIEVNLVDEKLDWPRIENDNEIMCVATTGQGRSFEDAVRIAFLELVLLMEKRFGINRFDGLMLCSQIGRIRVGNLWTVAAKVEKKYLKPFS
ncbi:MAG: acetamidase/formamidase family protein [Nitrososphaeria archaeon]|nr:acetamidase/formamidase family protein [Nitrososphaeria archaeon]